MQGPILADVLKTEQAAANLSEAGPLLSKQPLYVDESNNNPTGSAGKLQVRYLTEGKHKYALQNIRAAAQGDTVWLGMFYLADDAIINELLDASDRGAQVRLLLDPNQNLSPRQMETLSYSEVPLTSLHEIWMITIWKTIFGYL